MAIQKLNDKRSAELENRLWLAANATTVAIELVEDLNDRRLRAALDDALVSLEQAEYWSRAHRVGHRTSRYVRT